MAKYIKNEESAVRTYLGTPIYPGEYFLIPESKIAKWTEDTLVVQDVINGHLVVAKSNDDTTDFANALEGIDYLRNLVPQETHSTNYAFADKLTKDGKKLFRRKHGIAPTVCPAGQSLTLEFIVPYALCKINKLEIINGNANDLLDLIVTDTETGAIQQMMGAPAGAIVPFAPLNQFGFNVCLAKDSYIDESNYEAELYAGMKVVVVYKNRTAEEVEVGVNITLHEVK